MVIRCTAERAACIRNTRYIPPVPQGGHWKWSDDQEAVMNNLGLGDEDRGRYPNYHSLENRVTMITQLITRSRSSYIIVMVVP